MLSLKDSLWDTFVPMTASTVLDLFKTDGNYPYMHNRHFFPFKYQDLYYKINGKERYPSSESSMQQSADYLRIMTQ